MKNNHTSIKNFLISLEGKRTKIITNSNFKYETSNLRVIDQSIQFTDKLGDNVMMSISEIKQVTEVKE